MNKKGQGLTEYGIMLLLIVLIGTGVWFGFDMRSSEGAMYSTIASKLKSIAGTEGDSAVKDTGVTIQMHQSGNWSNMLIGHLTDVVINGATLYWYELNGNRVYDTQRGNTDNSASYWMADPNSGMKVGTNAIDFGDGTKGFYIRDDHGTYYKVSMPIDGGSQSVTTYTGAITADIAASADKNYANAIRY
jgi:uncharacterized protein (UPF0333 family)